ncbi:Response regulator receiver domain-containing protein [Ekhidna lutea]|uniref:Response regulator receiver domain-containing protein n=1 Tax=Ekhidna lutea TaxID=447679 RepID=A0A239FM02_EKHLU|nr:response regulator [Ekhidna lutea]SNS57837.1 Response regulator receiver domain-containing protein [Ekhidna lutea]
MGNPNKILLVDDDPIFLTLAELAIKKENETIEIYKAMNGEEAISFLKSQSVDVIFLDLNMPVMNGWEFLEALPEVENKGDHIYILTSSIDPSDQRKADENPLVTSMLEKPLDKAKITATLSS